METHGIDDAYGDDDEGSWSSMLLYLSMVFCNSCMQTKKNGTLVPKTWT
jgi:hypothetical protein